MRRHLLNLTVLLLAACSAAVYYYYVWILQRVNQKLRLDLVERLQSLSLRFHHGSRIGDAIYRTYQDSAMVTQLVSVLFLAPIGAVLQFLGVLVVVAAFDPWFALLLLGVLVIASTSVYAVAGLVFAARAFGSERVLFGGDELSDAPTTPWTEGRTPVR